MCPSPLRALYVLGALFVGLCVATSDVAFAGDLAPWFHPDSADQYLFVGKSVWDLGAGKVVAPTGGPNFLFDAHRVVGADDRVFLPGSDRILPGMAPVGFIAMLDGSAAKPITLDGKTSDSNGIPAFAVASDHRRVVWVDGGDYWRGEIDWPNAQVVNRKKVTSVGAFNPTQTPLLWWGNVIFVYGNFDKEKPIVRIDLVSGTTDELELFGHALEVNVGNRCFFGAVSPNHVRIARAYPAIIYSYDVRTGKPTMIRNKLEDITAWRGADVLQGDPVPFWADDDTAYTVDARGFLIKIDFRNARMDVLAQPEVKVYGDPVGTTRILGILPGGRYLDAYSSQSNHDMAVTFLGRFLIDRTTGQHLPLPFDDKAYGKWLDDSRYLYTVDKGGLSTVGIWLYDRASDATKRLAGGTIDYARMVVLKKQNQVYAVSQQSGSNLRRINLDGSGAQDLGPCEMAIPARLPVDDPVDLGFGKEPIDLWKPVTVDLAALAPTLPPEPPAGKLLLLEQIKDLPREQRDFADNAYDYAGTNATFGSYYDPTKVAMKMLDAHKSDPASPVGNLLMTVDFTAALDRDHIVRYGHDHSLELIAMDPKLTPAQKKEIANRVGPALADTFLKDAKPDVQKINLVFQKCLEDAKQAVAGGAGSPTVAPANPSQQQQQPVASQQQQTQSHGPTTQANPSPPPAPPQPSPPPANTHSKVDKATEATKKAKSAKDKLKGLFGQ
jgi:hypothetical protein